jgi:hypothetical protein
MRPSMQQIPYLMYLVFQPLFTNCKAQICGWSETAVGTCCPYEKTRLFPCSISLCSRHRGKETVQWPQPRAILLKVFEQYFHFSFYCNMLLPTKNVQPTTDGKDFMCVPVFGVLCTNTLVSSYTLQATVTMKREYCRHTWEYGKLCYNYQEYISSVKDQNNICGTWNTSAAYAMSKVNSLHFKC